MNRVTGFFLLFVVMCGIAVLAEEADNIKPRANVRIIIPFGSELLAYPDVKDFVMNEGMEFNELEVLFLGGEPRMYVYENKEVKVLEKSLVGIPKEEIGALVTSYGAEKRPKDE